MPNCTPNPRNVNNTRPRRENQQESTNRRGQKCTQGTPDPGRSKHPNVPIDRSVTQEASKRRSAGSRRQTAAASKGAADYIPQETETPAGTQVRDRATSERKHAQNTRGEYSKAPSAWGTGAASSTLHVQFAHHQDEVNTPRPWQKKQQGPSRQTGPKVHRQGRSRKKQTHQNDRRLKAGKSRSTGSRRRTAAASKGAAEKGTPKTRKRTETPST